jgi:hypothetical protein
MEKQWIFAYSIGHNPEEKRRKRRKRRKVGKKEGR